MPSVADRLTSYLAKRRKKSRYCRYLGVRYDNWKLKDARNRFMAGEAFQGRETLVNAILGDHSEDYLAGLLDDPNVKSMDTAHYLLRILTRAKNLAHSVMTEKEINESFEEYKKFYGNITVTILRNLVIAVYRRTFESREETTVDGMLVDLSQKSGQIAVYRWVMEHLLDPFILRLALSPQYWAEYNTLGLEPLLKSIRRNYRRFEHSKRKLVGSEELWKSLRSRLKKVYSGTKPQLMLAQTLRYCAFLSREKGVHLSIPNTFVSSTGKFTTAALRERHVKDFFESARFDIEGYSTALRYGLIGNPFELLETIVRKGYDRESMAFYCDWLATVHGLRKSVCAERLY